MPHPSDPPPDPSRAGAPALADEADARPRATAAAGPAPEYAPRPTDAVLEARALTKVYGSAAAGVTHTALDGFDLTVRRGEFLGIMGPSGSGKTTLLNLLATLDAPSSGSLRIGGEDPARMRPDDLARFRRRRLGFVFQDFNLLDTLTVRENVLLPLVLDRVPQREMLERLDRLATALRIDALLDRRPYEISGGQQQRAAIARAMIHEPALLLADEPTGNLDSAAAQDVMGALEQANREGGATVLMVTHDPAAASHASRIVFIRDGRPHSELRASAPRQAFFGRILDALGLMAGTP